MEVTQSIFLIIVDSILQANLANCDLYRHFNQSDRAIELYEFDGWGVWNGRFAMEETSGWPIAQHSVGYRFVRNWIVLS